MSRGVCICSSASRSRRRFPTAAAAPPTPAPGLATPAPGLQTGGAPTLSLRPPSAYRPRCPSSGAPSRQPDTRGGFRPANASHTLPPFFPTTRRAGDLSSYKFLLSLSRFPAAAPHRPPLRAVGHRPAGTGAVCSSFPSAPRRRGNRFLFCCIKVCPASPRCPPPSGHRPRALHPAALGGRHSPLTHRRAVPGIPAVRRWVIIHSLPHFPIARAPRL